MRVTEISIYDTAPHPRNIGSIRAIKEKDASLAKRAATSRKQQEENHPEAHWCCLFLPLGDGAHRLVAAVGIDYSGQGERQNLDQKQIDNLKRQLNWAYHKRQLGLDKLLAIFNDPFRPSLPEELQCPDDINGTYVTDPSDPLIRELCAIHESSRKPVAELAEAAKQ